jgi:hypothetical protein
MAFQLKLDKMLQNDITRLRVPEKTEKELDQLANRWGTAKIPWDTLSKYHLYQLGLHRKRMYLPADLPEVVNMNTDLLTSFFSVTTADEIVEEFFKNGRPLWVPHLGWYADYWVFWYVTHGRIRSDHNKKTRVFKHTKGDMSWITWSSVLKNSKPSDWIIINDDTVFQLICQVADRCNNVLCILRRNLQAIELNTAAARASFTNLNTHPEFVPFQQNRTRDHTQFRWKFQAKKKGGNQGFAAPAFPLGLAKQSVHFMMRELHEWLPSLRAKRQPKNVSRVKSV